MPNRVGPMTPKIEKECPACNKLFMAVRKSVIHCSKECIQEGWNIRYRELRYFINFMKCLSGCVDCGYDKHPAALDFDHVLPGKKRNVASCKTLKETQEEIEKCEVVCSNCHRIRTAEREQGFYGKLRQRQS